MVTAVQSIGRESMNQRGIRCAPLQTVDGLSIRKKGWQGVNCRIRWQLAMRLAGSWRSDFEAALVHTPA
ncbi:hypothetical protein CT19431_MP30383 [Cupriavidus taiwanensis]|nr:hypothetical protein CT19431_MP30383 [Cupriavidus taiwanensis]